MQSRPIPEDVALLAAEFAAWRKGRPHLRTHIPAELWRQAVDAAAIHSAKVVARSAKLDARKLRAALGELPLPLPVNKAKPLPSSAVRLAPLTILPTTTGSVVVEIEDPAGWRLRVSGGEAPAAVKAFMEARR